MKDNSAENPNEYINYYNESDFWKKINGIAKKVSYPILEKALTLYYCLKDKKTPIASKAIITGALGYLILPFDLIPDFIPVVGFTDDLIMLTVAIYTVSKNITDEHRNMAKNKLAIIFE